MGMSEVARERYGSTGTCERQLDYVNETYVVHPIFVPASNVEVTTCDP